MRRCSTAPITRLQGEVHPDRYAAAGETEQRLALQSSARVNEAYQALKDPVARAQYLLSLHGVDAFDETDTALAIRFPGAAARAAGGGCRGGRRPATRARSRRSSTKCAPRRASSKQRVSSLLDVDGAWDAARGTVRELRFPDEGRRGHRRDARAVDW